MCVLTSRENQEGLEWPKCKFSSSAPASKVPQPDNPTYHRGQTQFLLSLLQFPASLGNYSNKLITSSCGNQGSLHPLDTTKLASHGFCLFTLFPSATSKWPYIVCGVPFSWAVEYIGLIHCCSSHLSSVKCCVFSHPHNPKAGIPPSQTE